MREREYGLWASEMSEGFMWACKLTHMPPRSTLLHRTITHPEYHVDEQAAAIPALLKGKEAILHSYTGSGA